MMILRLALQKIRAMAGGYGFSAAVLAAAFALFFIIAATLGTTRTQLLRIALTDRTIQMNIAYCSILSLSWSC